jgi:FlaG/FlaF family flagellin (archaellin)
MGGDLQAQESPIFSWTSHFSYNESQFIAASPNRIYVSSSIAGYFIDNQDGSINILNKNQGLSDTGISATYLSEDGRKYVIGYENGNIDIFENASITNISDIKDAENFTNKSINDIAILGNDLWLATGFGMVRYDLEERVTSEAYQNIGQNGASLSINSFIISSDSIHAASDDGMLSVSLDDATNRQDFNFWQRQLVGIPFELISTNGDGLVASAESDLFAYSNGLWAFNTNLTHPITSIIEQEDRTFILTERTLLEAQMNSFDQILTAENEIIFLALAFSNSQFLIGTQSNGLAIYSNLTNDPEYILPPGPQSNFNLINKTSKNTFNWLSERHISSLNLNEDDWQIQEVKKTDQSSINNLNDLDLSVNTLVTSFDEGLFVHTGDGFDEINSFSPANTIVDENGNFRISAMASSPGLNTWIVQNRLSPELHRWNQSSDTWEAFDLDNPQSQFINSLFLITNGDKWMPIEDNRGGGVLVFNEEGNRERYLDTNGGQGGLPGSLVTDITEDLNGFIWITTDEGVCFFPVADRILTNLPLTANIPIFEEGLLLRDEFLTSIAVDPANRKWFGSQDEGAWLFNASGEELIHHFTIENSPLPSNEIMDIEIDPRSGRVFFTTAKGIVSFKSDATQGTSKHEDVRIYPNPVAPGFTGLVIMEGLVNNAELKITDISGKLVREIRANGATATWNVRTLRGDRVNAGVYLVFSSNRDGCETFIGKIVIN